MTIRKKSGFKEWLLGLVLALGLVTVVEPVWSESKESDQRNKIAVAISLDAFHKAAARADFDGYFSFFTDSGVFIGTDANERWSVDTFKSYVKPYFDQGKGWTYIPRNRTIVVHGDVAWFDELLDNKAYGECRGTGVLIKEGGNWKIAQYNLHFRYRMISPSRLQK